MRGQGQGDLEGCNEREETENGQVHWVLALL